jgi:hypothetical protein
MLLCDKRRTFLNISADYGGGSFVALQIPLTPTRGLATTIIGLPPYPSMCAREALTRSRPISAEGVLGLAQPEPLQLSCTGSIRVPLLPALDKPRRSLEGCRKLLSAANTQLSGIAEIATAKNRFFIVPTFSNKAAGRSMIARRLCCAGSGWGGNNPVPTVLLHWRSAATKLAG